MKLEIFVCLFLMAAGPLGTASLFDLTSPNPESQGQDEENEKAKSIALGISKEAFVQEMGIPDYVYDSEDGGFEELLYVTDLPYSAMLTVTVDKNLNQVVRISHGEDWEADRVLEGYTLPKIRRNDASKRKYRS